MLLRRSATLRNRPWEECVTDSLQSTDPGTQKRRSTRIVQAVPITVTGTDALGQPFKERTTTVMVNCHGCKYQSKHYVPKNSVVKLEIPQPEAGSKPKATEGRVVWVQRPRTVRELFQIGLEFEVPGNAWGIAFPPEDWAADALPVDYSREQEVPFEVASHVTSPIAGPEASVSPQPLPPMPPPPMPPASPDIRLDTTGAGPVIADAGTASSTTIPPASLTAVPAATPASSVPARPTMAPPVVPAPPKASIPVPPPMTSAPVASVPSSMGSTASTAGV